MDVASSDRITSICGHCNREIPSPNIDLHYAHCSRNLEKCKVCGDMVPKKHAEEHFLSTHAPVSCSLCNVTMEREILTIHKGESCPQRIVTCEFCEFPLPAVDLLEHQEVCGNRTELCPTCNRYVRLREKYGHESTCNGPPPPLAESSRRSASAVERDGNPQTRQPRPRPRPQPQPRANIFSRKRLLFTVAVTGFAVLIGSLFFQKKEQQNQLHWFSKK